ncbi:hypothetical protein MMC19_007124 [Ptychographa xylographoides]|nr:hypothetical protein [Ptychographa xylographoides]
MLPRPKSSSNLPYFDSRYDRLGGVDDDFDRSLEEIHLYLPLTINSASQSTELPAEDIERLIGARNLFAFLIGQVLVGTPKNPTLFPILLDVAGQLRRYEFTNFDASTFGETPATTFNSYTDDLGLDDVRSSREKTIEAIVLGERMRSWRLYNEGFVHGVGKWDDLVHLDHPIFSLISDTTRNRMEASSMDLQTRLKSMRDRLEDFEFPSLFAGIADSKANSKDADFKAWKASFAAMKKHTLTFYRNQYGAWPPKAKSKKNDFEESGLNRLLLKEVYQDLADLYDMLVDRLSLTTRTVDMLSHDEALSADPQVHALRKLMGEFDRSSPPVKPPIPFDLPQLPDLSTTRRDFASLSEKKQTKERNKRLKADEINMALMQSYNRESVKVTAFLEAFIAFERREAHGKPIQEIASLRVGQWIFLYVVLQSLPLVVVDAPGLKWTEGVEYFLCQIPKGSPPWVREDHSRKKGYYRAPGGSIVNLPSDIVDHGVEGIYRKSHCWRVAEKWTENDRISPDVPVRDASLEAQPSRQSVPQNFFNGADFDFGLPPPPNIDPDTMSRSRSRSADRQSPRGSPRLSVGGGLEALPLPPGVIPNGFQSATRTISTPDPTKSFEDILGTVVSPGKKKR